MTEATNNEFSACDMATAAAQGFRDWQRVALAGATKNASRLVRMARSHGSVCWEEMDGESFELYQQDSDYECREFYTSPPAAAVVMPAYSDERGSDGELTYEAKAWNAALDEVARLNPAPDHLRDAAKMVVPEGYVLVPAQMTDEMRDAGNVYTLNRLTLVRIWRAMLAAAPTPEPASPWISVEDRLPGIGERVIVFTGEVEEAFYWARMPGVHDGEDGFCDLFDNDVEVSHWMPLPSAPEQPAKEQGHE